MGAGSSKITFSERDAILSRLRQLGRTNEACRIVASEFGRGITTITRLRPSA